jgi:hypothetical protein
VAVAGSLRMDRHGGGVSVLGARSEPCRISLRLSNFSRVKNLCGC